MGISTNRLNTAIERMSTGYKINHASDNAANYSISKNMSTQLSACDIAADNIAMGIDFLTVAQDTISELGNRGNRLHALITQARNGVYGAASLAAVNTEVESLISEINRICSNTEYNGKKLFDGVELPEWAKLIKESSGKDAGLQPEKAEELPEEIQKIKDKAGLAEDLRASNNGFLTKVDETTPDYILTNPANLDYALNNFNTIGIGDADCLAALFSSGNACEGKNIVLTNDISLSKFDNWAEVTGGYKFYGIFNGNGHTISNLNSKGSGLFAILDGAEVKNLKVEGNVSDSGILAIEVFRGGTINNCSTAGKVVDGWDVGGLVSWANIDGGDVYITNCYSTADIFSAGGEGSGGLIANGGGITIENCFASGNVNGTSSSAGGLVGNAYGCKISQSYATGNVNGISAGGLIGWSDNSDVQGCYANGDVYATAFYGGGLIGCNGAEGNAKFNYIETCYAEGNVYGEKGAGGLIGCLSNRDKCNTAVCNAYSTSNVSGNEYIGNFIGVIIDDEYSDIKGIKFDGIYSTTQNPNMIGDSVCWKDEEQNLVSTDYDLTDLENSIKELKIKVSSAPITTAGAGYRADKVSVVTPDIIVGSMDELVNTLSDNYHKVIGIGDAETLRRLADVVGACGIECEGKTIVLTNDIDLEYYWDGPPIGCEDLGFSFKGIFNGNGYTISHLKSESGLFGKIENAVIKNLILKDCTVRGYDNTGLLAGYAEESSIENCSVSGSVIGEGDCIGGLVGNLYGSNSVIKNCTAEVNIDFTGKNFVGGLVGEMKGGIISNNITKGEIIVDDSNAATRVGGMFGSLHDVDLVNNCHSLVNINASSSERVGGLIGLLFNDNDTKIMNCSTSGSIFGREYIGGIVGLSEIINGKFTINNCCSACNTYADDGYIGGILGADQGESMNISDCYSTGDIKGNYCVGGITGSINAGSITNCYSIGNITGGSKIGGIAGVNRTSEISNCYSTGNVAGKSNIGGIVGYSEGTINYCHSAGNISGEWGIGGIAGITMSSISNSYSVGQINSQDGLAGGIAGECENTIQYCYSTGNVAGKSNIGGLLGAGKCIYRSYATGNVYGSNVLGGIAGTVSDVVESYAKGNVTGDNKMIGGLVGELHNTITDSYATGNAKGDLSVGGLVGCSSNSECAVKGSYSTGTVTANDYSAGIGTVNSIKNSFTTSRVIASGENNDKLVLGSNIDSSEAFIANTVATFFVGTTDDSDSQISVDTSLNIELNINDLTSDSAYTSITNFLNQLSQKSVEIGAAQNRLESALESNLVKMDNLTSSLSTIRDADISKVSSEFIRQQILQQAAATLMSTANQSPSSALQLL